MYENEEGSQVKSQSGRNVLMCRCLVYNRLMNNIFICITEITYFHHLFIKHWLMMN